MIRCFILLLYAYTVTSIGYDAGGGDRTTCGRPYRAGRLYQPPCDLGRFGYCTQAGELYPWRAVRRFVKDNQGLMRRMYGDQRHGHVLRAELDDNDFEEEWEKNEREKGGYGRWRPTPIRYARYQHHEDIDNDLEEDLDFDFDHPYEEEPRYLRRDLTNDDVLNTKFVISEQEEAIAIKLAELKAAAHFRPVNHRGQFTTQRTPSSSPRTPKSTTTQKSTTPTTTIKPINTTTVSNKTKSNDIRINEEITDKRKTTRTTTETPSMETTDSPTVITSTTTTTSTKDDLNEHSTTDTTTDRTTQWISKKISTTPRTFVTKMKPASPITTEKPLFNKTTTKQPVANDRLGEFHSDTEKFIVTNDKVSDVGDQHIDNSDESLKHSGEILDQTGEGSENSEVYSDEEGNVKQVHTGSSPAMLFQDVEDEAYKKKGPVNYNKMKGINACPVKEEVVAPFWANNTRGEVLALLNMYPFEQYVHWEKCTFEHKQMYCRDGCRCEQQYRLHRLLAYDPKNECRGIFSDWFRFPSCCICKCYDMPPEFRVTSRSPRFQMHYSEDQPGENN